MDGITYIVKQKYLMDFCKKIHNKYRITFYYRKDIPERLYYFQIDDVYKLKWCRNKNCKEYCGLEFKDCKTIDTQNPILYIPRLDKLRRILEL